MCALFAVFQLLLAAPPLSEPETVNIFGVTGLVVHVTRESIVLHRDDGQDMRILTDNRTPPALGETIFVSCYEDLPRFQEPASHMVRFDVVGRGPIPPPKEIRIEDLLKKAVKNERVTLLAETEDYFIDDVDTRYYYLSLKSGPHRIYGAMLRADTDISHLDSLLGATVRITGVIYEQHGARRFVGNRIAIDNLQIVKPAEQDLAKLPPLDESSFSLPQEISRLSRHRASGIVLAVWQYAKILIRTPGGQVVEASLRAPGALPHIGDTVTIAGYPATDFFNLSLVGARWQPCSMPDMAQPQAAELYNGELFTDIHGNHSIVTTYHGTIVRVRGKVLRGGKHEMEIDLGQGTVIAHAGVWTSAFDPIEPNSVVDLTGVAILESSNWSDGKPFPRIRGVSIVTRRDSDIIILRHPPWWTPTRILIAFAGLIAFIAGLIVWNRILMRLAARRSRELIREQLAKERSELKTDERTRLAIELHDSLSQNLSGLGCQLVATRLVLNTDSPACARLETAERMLQSTRTELKRCLFDLREDLLEDPDFERAVRTTLGTLLGTCQLKLRIHIARSVMDDSVAHAVLSIVRELVSNAIRHGRASKVQVAGSLQYGPDPTQILVSVRDNGKGFDPQSCAGPIDGHFGLTGIRDRISRAGGSFRIESASGRTYARFSIPV